ncbi:hypothetical protein [Tumebacillus amylolyticus]|nr:hypothetical protein [Tumebacillus amylolyticus]
MKKFVALALVAALAFVSIVSTVEQKEANQMPPYNLVGTTTTK